MKNQIKKPRQLNLFKTDLRFFGGRLLHGKRRSRRPLNTNDPIHIVMRSSWANGSNSFLHSRNKKEIERLIAVIATKNLIRVYQKAIVGNHIHILLKISHRQNYKTFVRVLSSAIASHVMKKQSFKVFKRSVLNQEWGDPQSNETEVQGKGQAFWQFRPWTRVLHWGKDYKMCTAYLIQNILEALGFIEYKPRSNRYAKWIQATSAGECNL